VPSTVRTIIGVDLLIVAARPALDDPAADEGVIGDLAVGQVPSRLRPDARVPNGLNGLVASMVILSSRLPLPESGPTNSGSGAAWFFELRRL
jgi:hypothetical protein